MPKVKDLTWLKSNLVINKYRSRRLEVFCKKTLLKKRPSGKCFPVSFEKFLRTPFLKEHLWWLLLQIGQVTSRMTVQYFNGVAFQSKLIAVTYK